MSESLAPVSDSHPLPYSVDKCAGWARSYLKRMGIPHQDFIQKLSSVGVVLSSDDLTKDEAGANPENENLTNAIVTVQQKALTLGLQITCDGMLGRNTMLALDQLSKRAIQGKKTELKLLALQAETAGDSKVLTLEAMQEAVSAAKEAKNVLKKPSSVTLIGGSLLNGGGVVASLPKGVNQIGWNGASTSRILSAMEKLKTSGQLPHLLLNKTLVIDAGVGNDLMANKTADSIMNNVRSILDLCTDSSPSRIILMTRPPYNLETLISVLKRNRSEEEARKKATRMQEENIKLAALFRQLASDRGYQLIDANGFTSQYFPTETTYGVHPKDRLFYEYVSTQLTSIANENQSLQG